MNQLILNFPNNIKEAIVIAENFNPHIDVNRVQQIVICGMGGSGIGGRIVAQWVDDYCSVPVLSIQDYTLPAFVGENTLVIGSSYSGNTEETLFAIEEASKRGAQIIGICSGGKLAEICSSRNYPWVQVPGGNPPRTALAFSLVQLCKIFQWTGFGQKNLLEELAKGQELIVSNLTAIQAEAMEIAQVLQKKVVAIYSGAAYEAITIRAKQQINENSKELCWQHVIPEMNHNELVGWGDGDERFAALFLQTNDLSPRNQRRFEISVERTKSKTKSVVIVNAHGSSRIVRSIYLIHLIDWLSLYLSDLKNGDPIEIEIIDYLKDELSKL